MKSVMMDTFFDLMWGCNTGKEDLMPLLRRMAIDIAANVAFGHHLNSLKDPNRQFTDKEGKQSGTIVEALFWVFRGMNYRVYSPESLWELPLPILKRDKKGFSILVNLFENELEKHKQTPLTEDTPIDLLYLILSNNDYVYSHQEIIGECRNIFFAGHDSTTNSSSFLIAMLAQYQDVQRKAREEVDSVCAQSSDPANYRLQFDDMYKLKYIEMFLKEVLRLYTVVPVVLRKALQDDDINGKKIHKGTTIMLNVQGYHRDENIFPKAKEFIPERWDDNKDTPLLAFGYGLRQCFGRRFDWMVLKLEIFMLLKRYQVFEVPGHSIKNCVDTFGLKPVCSCGAQHVRIRVEER